MPKRMDDIQKQALARALELNRHGKSWPEVAEILASEGVVALSCKPYSGTTLRIACKRLSDAALSTEAANRPGNNGRGKRPDTGRKPARSHFKSDKLDTITKRDIEALLENVKFLVDEKIQAALGTPRTAASIPPEDNPPSPPKTGKKFHGAKSDLRARIDSNLMTLLEADCESHYNGNMSRCLDAILWRYYGRPTLSFQEQTRLPAE